MTSPSSLRWGILGPGGIARAFTSDLRTAGLDVAAVGSRRQQTADAFAADFGIPRAHGSYEDLVADPDVDIVYVATPHPMHAANARLAQALRTNLRRRKAAPAAAAKPESPRSDDESSSD